MEPAALSFVWLAQLEIYFQTVRLFSLCSEDASRSAIMEVVEMESESSYSLSSLSLIYIKHL